MIFRFNTTERFQPLRWESCEKGKGKHFTNKSPTLMDVAGRLSALPRPIAPFHPSYAARNPVPIGTHTHLLRSEQHKKATQNKITHIPMTVQ